jgi:FkbM family methyltransferase
MTNALGSLITLLGNLTPCVRIIDVGALWLGETCQVYRPLLRSGNASVVGFEPFADECESLNQRFAKQNHLYLPYAIGDGTKHLFYICNFPMTSSLLEPDLSVMNLYHDLPQYCQVTSLREMETHRLDDIKEIGPVDYLKIDVQGSELEVLKGARRTLQDTLVVHTEVEFAPIYRNQPLFAEVDQFLRGHGFMFHSFMAMEGRPLESFGKTCPPKGNTQQLLWSDAVYVRQISGWDHLRTDSLLKLAVILHEVYKAYDFSARLLHLYDARIGGNYCPQYLEMLGAGAEI